MTTPNIEELMKMLRAKGCPDWVTARWLMESAADALQSQAERIAELEKEITNLKAYAKHERSLGAEPFAIENNDLRQERDTLRAQLDEIAATEPVGAIYTIAGVQHCTITKTLEDTDLFTRPMPAQDAAELVNSYDLAKRADNEGQP